MSRNVVSSCDISSTSWPLTHRPTTQPCAWAVTFVIDVLLLIQRKQYWRISWTNWGRDGGTLQPLLPRGLTWIIAFHGRCTTPNYIHTTPYVLPQDIYILSLMYYPKIYTYYPICTTPRCTTPRYIHTTPYVLPQDIYILPHMYYNKIYTYYPMCTTPRYIHTTPYVLPQDIYIPHMYYPKLYMC